MKVIKLKENKKLLIDEKEKLTIELEYPVAGYDDVDYETRQIHPCPDCCAYLKRITKLEQQLKITKLVLAGLAWLNNDK